MTDKPDLDDLTDDPEMLKSIEVGTQEQAMVVIDTLCNLITDIHSKMRETTGTLVPRCPFGEALAAGVEALLHADLNYPYTRSRPQDMDHLEEVAEQRRQAVVAYAQKVTRATFLQVMREMHIPIDTSYDKGNN